ncbi:MAG: hypothetical protein GXP62_19675 [Oligoflexia bacterium]|nr:hypothetical protein [Oligoflexia bacterium]
MRVPTLLMPLFLLLAPGCFMMDPGPHGRNDHWAGEGNNGGPGHGNGDHGSAGVDTGTDTWNGEDLGPTPQDCLALEDQLTQGQDDLETSRMTADERYSASWADLDKAWSDAEDTYTSGLAAAEQTLADTLAAIYAERADTLGSLLDSYNTALADQRYEDAALVFAAYLAAEEASATAEADAFATYSATVADLEANWNATQEELSTAASQLQDSQTATDEELATWEEDLGQLAAEVDDCWAAVGAAG